MSIGLRIQVPTWVVGLLAVMLLAVAPLPAGVAGTSSSELLMTEPLLPERQPITSFVPYTNTHSGFALDVPSGWRIQAHYLEDLVFGYTLWYSVTGPPDSASHFGFNQLEVTAVPKADFGGLLPSLSDYIALSRDEYTRPSATLVLDTATTFLGTPARELEIQYTDTRPEYAATGGPTTVTAIRRWLIFEHAHHFFEIAFVTTSADRALYQPAYDTAKSTFTFLP